MKTATPKDPEPRDAALARLLSLAGPRPTLSEARRQRLKAAVRPHWQAAVQANARRWTPRIAAALATAAMLALAFGLHFLPQPVPPAPLAVLETTTGPVLRWPSAGVAAADARPLTAGDELRAGDRLQTKASRAALRLAGGASLRLDRETRLRMIAPRILALEAGAVYVDSRQQAGLSIRTAIATVEEIGTQFEVRLANASLRLRVREGGVVLHHAREVYEGRPGEELTLGESGELSRATVPLYGDPWSWVLEVAPALDLEGRTLDGFLRWVARETGAELRFSSPELARHAFVTRVFGDVDDLAPPQALDVVLPTCGVISRFEDGVLYIEPETAR